MYPMGLKEENSQLDGSEINGMNSLAFVDNQNSSASRISECSTDEDAGLLLCRVCHCAESDRRGDAALGFLDIMPPSQDFSHIKEDGNSSDKFCRKRAEKDDMISRDSQRVSGSVELVSSKGEIFLCNTDVESGSSQCEDALIDLGCSCKNDLALAHYACVLKWFISHGSTICEICGTLAKNIRLEDFRKVMTSLKNYEALRERTAAGEVTYLCLEANSGVNLDAIAGIQRERLSEISLWFNPHNYSAMVSQGMAEQLINSPNNNPADSVVASERLTNKWALEGTGFLIATGLVTITLAWLVAPHVGKKTAIIGLHMLLGGLCAVTIVIFLRHVVPKINYGPAQHWAILFIFWFLVFGVWASRTHSTRSV
ncbi:uncharacterized protein [Typha angustifolia]|uniref:uncharacterized protein n=1 Tax=Typha angustifolia TaxID=59011 RepID=UPI003C30CADF